MPRDFNLSIAALPELIPSQFSNWAHAAGLTRVWVVSRAEVDAAFPGEATAGEGTAGDDAAGNDATGDDTSGEGPARTPATLHPGYRAALVLASPGRMFWEGFRGAVPRMETAGPNPLDRYSEEVVEALAGRLGHHDPTALTVYPFHHERQLLGFGRLVGGARWTASTPFGMTVDPHFGPWFAWRGAILTALDWPTTPMPETTACEGCPAPCVTACPSGAVALAGFDWETCADFRVNARTCRETCPARLACPVGSQYRYGEEQMRYHYGASLRMIERWAGRKMES